MKVGVKQALIPTRVIPMTHLLKHRQQDMLMNQSTQHRELKKLPPVEEMSSDNSDDDLDSSRLENLHWCRCKNNCVILHTLIECKCYREYENLLSSKLQNIDCISQHEEFQTLCLNTSVLETAFVLHRRRNRIFKELDKMSNK